MSSALARSSPAPLALVTWTAEQRSLIKRTVAVDATDDELSLFLHIAAKSGLDPLQRQIHFTKRNGKVTTVAGIDGLQARAAREPDYEGLLHGVVCAKDEFVFDAAAGAIVKHSYNAFSDRGAVLGAWATVKRRGKLPFTVVVKFAEYNQGNSPTWRQMPLVMIDKVARSSALRMAFPEAFSSIYEPAEMDQAQGALPAAAPARAPQPVTARVVEAEVVEAPAIAADSRTAAVRAHVEAHVKVKMPEAYEALRTDKAPTVAFGPCKGRPLDTLADDELAEAAMLAEKDLEEKPSSRYAKTLRANLDVLHSEMQRRAPRADEPGAEG